MSKFFSFKLYREGIKKSRLMGITCTAIVAIITALIPLVQLLTPHYYEEGYVPSTQIIEPAYFAIPLLFLIIFAPLLTWSMFSYLNKRNESDFYHSIPFTRPCVYFSFLAASLTWVVIALIISLVAATILWLAVPYTAFSFTTPLVLFGAYLLASLLMSSFMAVAMTLTGTPISNMLIFILLFGFVRLSGAFFIMALESQYPILVTALTPARLLSIDYSMPLSLFVGTVDGNAQAFSNAGLWIYTAIVSILLIAAGCYLYAKRRSEMAGQSAPNRILQHVYRCAITLPLAFLTAFYVIDVGFEIESLLILVVLTLIVYYLYEIITTKKLKNCLSATPYLLVVLAGGILFGVSVPLAGNAAVHYTPNANEIRSISLYTEKEPFSYYSSNYETLLTQKVEISSPEALQMISNKLAEMKQTIDASDALHYLYPNRYNDVVIYDDGGYYKEETTYTQVTLKITDQSGTVRGRTLCFTTAEYLQLITLFAETEAYESALLALPTDQEILNIEIYDNYFGANNEKELPAIWNSFVTEYNQLSREEQIAYKSEDWYTNYCIRVNGMVGMDSFYRNYGIDIDRFPETCRLLIERNNRSWEQSYTELLTHLKRNTAQQIYVTMDVDGVSQYSLQGQAHTYLEALEFLENCQAPTDNKSLILSLYISSDYGYVERHYILSEADLLTFYELVGVQLDTSDEKTVVIVD